MALDEPADIPSTVVDQIAMGMILLHGHGDFALAENEAAALAKAMANVGKWYISVSPGGKGGAWLALIGTALLVETPKLMTRMARLKAEAEARKAAAQSARPAAPDPMVVMPA